MIVLMKHFLTALKNGRTLIKRKQKANDMFEQAESLLKNGKVFVPTDVTNRLENKTATTTVVEDVLLP